MMGMLWVVFFVALTGSHFGYGLPIGPTPQTYPYDGSGAPASEGWNQGGLYAALPALALLITAVGLLFGCTWCYRHKNCKPNQGEDNQLFASSVTQHLHEVHRSNPPDSGFSEPVNNNITEDNNNGPISFREMENIENNNAAAYITTMNEDRNRITRDSVILFEPLPILRGTEPVDPMDRQADWFGGEEFSRSHLQYLREIGRGWFGRVVEGEIEDRGTSSTVAVKILNQSASHEERAQFLEEGRLYRDANHENVLGFVAKCLQEDPWILIFELCPMDLQQYLIVNRHKMAALNEAGVPLRLMCDVSSALAYVHSLGHVYGATWTGSVLVRGTCEEARAVLGRYSTVAPPFDTRAPEQRRPPHADTCYSDVYSLGTLVWQVCTWGMMPPHQPPPLPDLPCPYRTHLYQVMQLCWSGDPYERPSSGEVLALITHLYSTHVGGGGSGRQPDADFETRWQRLKPNHIPVVDEHRAQVHVHEPSTSATPPQHYTQSSQVHVHVPSTSATPPQRFTKSDQVQVHVASTSSTPLHHSTGSEEYDEPASVQDSLSVDMDTAVSRSSSIMSDKDPLSAQIKSESLTNLHGSLEDVRNIYLTHDEMAVSDCHQGNIALEKEHGRSDGSVDPWLKDIIAGSQDDVSYYKDVSDVIKNLDNILNSEKTSSSESSHQASPSRDNLSLDCKKDYPMQSSMVKSPGISNFQNILEAGFVAKSPEPEACAEDDADRDTIGTLSHSFERHSDTTSQQTLENITPDTPVKDLDINNSEEKNESSANEYLYKTDDVSQLEQDTSLPINTELPNEHKIVNSDSKIPKLKELCVASIPSVSEINVDLSNGTQDCIRSCDNNIAEERTDKEIETKSIDDVVKENVDSSPVEKDTENDEVLRSNSSELDKVVLILPKAKTETSEPVVEMPSVTDSESMIMAERKASELGECLRTSDSLEFKDVNEEISVSDLILPVGTITDPVIESKIEVDDFKDTIKNDMTKTDNTIKTSSIGNSKAPESVQNSFHNEETAQTPHIEELTTKLEEISATQLLSPEAVQNIDKEIPGPIEMVVESLDGSKNEDINLPKTDIAIAVCNEMSLQNVNASEIVDLGLPKSDKESQVHSEISFQNKENLNVEDTKLSTSEKQTPDYNKTIQNVESTDLSKDNHTETQEAVTDQSNDSTAYMNLSNTTNDTVKDKTIDGDMKEVIKSCLDMSTAESSCTLVKNESTMYMDLPSTIKETDSFLQSERTISSHNDRFVNVCSSTPIGSDHSTDNTLENSVKYNDVETIKNIDEKLIEDDILSETKVPDYGRGVFVTKLEQRYVPDSMSPFESPTKSHPTDTYDENSSVVLGPFENCTLELYKGVKSIDAVDLPKEELLAFSSNFSEINLETPSPLRDRNFLNEVPDIIHDDIQFDDLDAVSEHVDKSGAETEDSSEKSGTEKRASPLTPPNSPGNFLASTSQQTYSIVDIDLDPPMPSTSEVDSGLPKEVDLNQIELQITTKLAMAENENNLNIEYSGPLTVEGVVSDETMILHESDGEGLEESYLAGNGGSSPRAGLELDEECVKALRDELELKLPLAQVSNIEPACPAEWGGSLPPPPELILSYPGALSPIAEETRQQLSAYESDAQWNFSTRTDSSESYPEPCNNSTDEVTDLPTGLRDTYTLRRASDSDSDRDRPDRTYTLNKDNTSKEVTMSVDSLNGSPYKKPANDSPIDDRTYNKNDEEKESCERISQVSPYILSPTTDTSAPSDVVDNTTGVSTLSKTTVPTDANSSKPSETQCLSKTTSIDSWCSNDTLYNVEENFDDLAMDPDMPAFERSESSDTLTHDKDLSHCSTYIVHDSRSERDAFSPDSITADDCTYTKKADVKSDLAYGTLMSGLPSSNCTAELASHHDDWRRPELVRRSPHDDALLTPPKLASDNRDNLLSPRLATRPLVNKMDSVDLSCMHDDNESAEHDSPQCNYGNMAPSVTSTPLAEVEAEKGESDLHTPEFPAASVPTFQTFLQSAEVRPQDCSPRPTDVEEKIDGEVLLEGDSRSLSRSNRDNPDRTPNYSDFETSALTRPQDAPSRSSQSLESGISSDDFRHFENSLRTRPQDLSDPADATNSLLNSERKHSDSITDQKTSTDKKSPRHDSENKSLDVSPPNTNLVESHHLANNVTPFYNEEETEQPHSIIMTEVDVLKDTPNRTFDSHTGTVTDLNHTYDSHSKYKENNSHSKNSERVNGFDKNYIDSEITSPKVGDLLDLLNMKSPKEEKETVTVLTAAVISEAPKKHDGRIVREVKCNGNSENYATVQFLNETFEELIESNVDDGDCKDFKLDEPVEEMPICTEMLEKSSEPTTPVKEVQEIAKDMSHSMTDLKEEVSEVKTNGVRETEERLTSVTEDFLQNEKKFCQLDSYFPLLSDIRFTGPAAEIMSTSFTQDSPTEPTSPECERDGKSDAAADILKEWDSDSDSHSTNSSSGEFIWKDGDGHETPLVPSTHFQHQRGSGGQSQSHGSGESGGDSHRAADAGSGLSDASGDSGSGSEGDEVEFVPSSWDCRAAPAKSSLRSLETTPDNKKRVVFKRQKYHCVYEYPREVATVDASPAAYVPDLSTYSDWEPSSAEEAELGYGQLFGAPSPLDLYPLRAGVAFDYDEDFFISSSARPFESLGLMSTTSQFFPGMYAKGGLEREPSEEDLSPPSPPPPPLLATRTPSLDLTTPDSGVEDITPSVDEDFKPKPASPELPWRLDTTASPDSVSPTSPADVLGGLRHTRDKLKLDLPPSPLAPSPRVVFSFALDKRRRDPATPLVMSDDTPAAPPAPPAPPPHAAHPSPPEPTFSTFGKPPPPPPQDRAAIVLTDDASATEDTANSHNPAEPKAPDVPAPLVEPVKGEGTVLDSGDEDSGIESSSKATLERTKTSNVS